MPSQLTMRRFVCNFEACQFNHIICDERIDRLCRLPQCDAFHTQFALYVIQKLVQHVVSQHSLQLS